MPTPGAAVRMRVGTRRAMSTGTVKWFSDARGYGFIAPDEGGPDLFVRFTGILGDFRTLAEGERVEFEVREGRDGPEAHAVVACRHVIRGRRGARV
jgi:CspA family cold shock protein